MKPILEFQNISKKFFAIKALQEISLELVEGEILGLIGQNGAGKSTLMNVLGGVVQQDAGTMRISGEPYAPREPREAIERGVAFIHQELNLFDNLSIAENILIDKFPRIAGTILNRHMMLARTRDILRRIDLNLPATTKVASLSPGEKQLVEIGKAISSDARIIIFDEPTTSLTSRETERLFRIILRLKSEGKSLLYISHILKDVAYLADEIAVLRDGRLVAKDRKESFTPGKMISMMVGRDIENIFPKRKAAGSGGKILQVRSLSQQGIVKDISLDVARGEIVGLFGLMGSGRTELARIIFGLDDYESGEIRLSSEMLPKMDPIACIKRGVAFVTEDRRQEGLMMQQSISANLELVSLRSFLSAVGSFVVNSSVNKAVGDVAHALDVKSANLHTQLAKNLSGGNQQKTVIGKWLIGEPALLLMDEPTKGIDVGAKFEVYSIMNNLAANGAGILFISSELEELIGLSDRIIVLNQGEIIQVFDRGDFIEERILQSAFRHEEANGQQGSGLAE
jgi:ribose transport system ATP-binding protein